MSEMEPVCWNCLKAYKIRDSKGDILFYEPCAYYINNMKCQYVPEIKPSCEFCQHYDKDVGCLYGYAFASPKCVFIPKDNYIQKSIDSMTNLRMDMCYVCPFRKTLVEFIKEKCPNCPINWEEYGIKF